MTDLPYVSVDYYVNNVTCSRQQMDSPCTTTSDKQPGGRLHKENAVGIYVLGWVTHSNLYVTRFC